MKIFCCYTPSHRVLFEKYFRPSLPPNLRLTSYELDGRGVGNFRDPGFIAAVSKKVDLFVRSVQENPGEIIVWSDVDVVVSRDPEPAILAALGADGGKDLVYQREARALAEVNSGFHAMRCNPRTERFFRDVAEGIRPAGTVSKQTVVNQLLRRADAPRWGYLPMSFYARNHGWPPPKDLVLYHATLDMKMFLRIAKGKNSVQQKIEQFEELAWMQRHGQLARTWSATRRVPAKLWDLVGPRKRHPNPHLTPSIHLNVGEGV